MVDKVRTVYELLIELERALVGDTRTSRVPTVVMGPVNKDANGASEGWVGVYADTVAYTPRTVGAGMGNWGSSTVLRVIVQRSHLEDPKEAFRLLSELIKDVVDVILKDPSMQSVSENLPSIDVAYGTRDSDATTLYFQGAVVTIRFDGRSLTV